MIKLVILAVILERSDRITRIRKRTCKQILTKVGEFAELLKYGKKEDLFFISHYSQLITDN